MCLYKLFKTTLALASFLTSITILIPSKADSSLKLEIPSITLSLTSSPILWIKAFLLTWYGSSVITILCLLWVSSTVAIPLIVIAPLPLSYALLMPLLPRITPAVGKSGPLIYCISSVTVISGLSI